MRDETYAMIERDIAIQDDIHTLTALDVYHHMLDVIYAIRSSVYIASPSTDAFSLLLFFFRQFSCRLRRYASMFITDDAIDITLVPVTTTLEP